MLTRMKISVLAGAFSGAAMLVAGAALADSAPRPDPFAKYADPEAVVLAVATEFDAVGGAVRMSVYDRETVFLEEAALKTQAEISADGVAVARLNGLAPGSYAFVAYLDENRDGRLNRGPLGVPKEPYAFSNGVKPVLRKPKFDETKVDVAPGAVVVITLED